MPLSLTPPECHMTLIQHESRRFQSSGYHQARKLQGWYQDVFLGSSGGEQHQYGAPVTPAAPCQYLFPPLGFYSPSWSIKLHSHRHQISCVFTGSSRKQFYSLSINTIQVKGKQNSSVQALSPILRASGPTNALMMFAEVQNRTRAGGIFPS